MSLALSMLDSRRWPGRFNDDDTPPRGTKPRKPGRPDQSGDP